MNFVNASSGDRELGNFINFMWSNQVEFTGLWATGGGKSIVRMISNNIPAQGPEILARILFVSGLGSSQYFWPLGWDMIEISSYWLGYHWNIII